MTLTLYQLIQTRYLLASIHRVQCPDPLGKVDIVREGPGELHKQRIQGSKAVVRHGIHQTLEVFITIAIKAHFFGFLLGCEGLERARAVEAAVRAVRRARDQPVTSGPGLGPGARSGLWCPVRLLSLLEMLKLNTSA